MKLGFIGSGNMANAIIKGVTSSQAMKADDVIVFDIDASKALELQKNYKVRVADSTAQLVKEADVVVLAVKPVVFPALLPQISADIKKKNPLVVSIAAGKTISFITNFLFDSVKLVRVMPNINAKVGAAMNAYCCSASVSEEETAWVEQIFRATGEVMALDEAFFPLFGVIAGSAPAFAYMFIDALARSAVKNGMNKQVALKIAAQTVLGSAKLVLESGEHPWSLIDQVCSPGGTTIEGISSLQNDRLDAAITKAVDACVEKDSKI